MNRAAAAFALWALAAMAGAEPLTLSLPIDCQLGQNCYIEDYVDADEGPGQSDYSCGLKTRNDHRGTDFVLGDLRVLHAGVDVLAASPGIVAATRDGMPDRPVTGDSRDEIEGRECGNAVRIDHGDGWQTLYCHMAQNSIRVRTGYHVAAGAPLGRVGLSGLTNVPHLHFSVLKEGQIVDPFDPTPMQTCGNDPGNGLWMSAPIYNKSGLFTVGFSTEVPEFDEVQSGAARKAQGAPDTPIVLYAYAFHPLAGDTLTLSATGPTGEIFRKIITIDAPKAHLFRAFGRRGPRNGWPAGSYRGTVLMQRDGHLLAARHAEFTVRP